MVITSNARNALRVQAGKYLKPYQGLKLEFIIAAECPFIFRRKIPKTLSGIETRFPHAIPECEKQPRAGKYLKPYQGLKLRLGIIDNKSRSLAGKYLKPYQGLKLMQ